MSDFPDRLRTARERLGLSIEDISARTRIKAEMLHALERGDVSRLPGTFYAKAFIRTYAREVGLPADELVADYAATEEHPRQSAVRLEDIPPVKGVRGYDAPRASAWQLVPIAALVAAAVFFLGTRGRDAADTLRAPEAGAVGTSGTAASDVVHAVSPPSPAADGAQARAAPGTERPSAAFADRLVMQITPSAPVWVTATADGTRVIYRLLNPGERAVVEARDEIALRVGDAGAFVYTLNGADGVMLGDPGAVRSVRITRESYSAFTR